MVIDLTWSNTLVLAIDMTRLRKRDTKFAHEQSRLSATNSNLFFQTLLEGLCLLAQSGLHYVASQRTATRRGRVWIMLCPCEAQRPTERERKQTMQCG